VERHDGSTVTDVGGFDETATATGTANASDLSATTGATWLPEEHAEGVDDEARAVARAASKLFRSCWEFTDPAELMPRRPSARF